MRIPALLLLAACAGPELAITPESPTTVDDLEAVVDLPEGARVVWRRDGLLASEGRVLPADRTAKHEVWTAEVVRGMHVLAEASVTIRNSPPHVLVSIDGDARRGQTLHARANIDDDDGDEVLASWRWLRDGSEVAGLVDDTVPGSELHQGEQWEAEGTFDDGDDLVHATTSSTDVVGPGSIVLDPLRTRLWRLTLTPGARASLEAEPDAWVAADLTVVGYRELHDVGVRMKGRGSFEPLDERPALLIDTDRFVDGQHLDGLERFALDNMHSDPSLVRERLAYDLFRAAGVPAPRAVHVGLMIDDASRGPYTLVEGVDERFLDEAFGDGTGPLFEMPGVELTEEGVDALDHDSGTDVRARLRDLATLLATPEASLSGSGADLVDVDAWARYLAACGIVAHYDGYPFKVPGDDLYLYVDPSDSRIRFVAHGADEAFHDPDKPVTWYEGLLGQLCLREGPCRTTLVQAVWDFEDVAEEVDLAAKVDLYADQVDTMIYRGLELQVPGFDPSGRGAAQDEVVDFVERRREDLSEMITLGGGPQQP